jgi:hypothetical protein
MPRVFGQALVRAQMRASGVRGVMAAHTAVVQHGLNRASETEAARRPSLGPYVTRRPVCSAGQVRRRLYGCLVAPPQDT